MRSFAPLFITVALGFAACNDKETFIESATDTMATTTTTGPEDTTGTPGTTTTTTTSSVPQTTGDGETTIAPTTGPAATTTTTTTGETTDATTTMATLGETETIGETEGVLPPMGPYEGCSNANDIECAGEAPCVDATSTNGTVKGSFCAPPCMGAMKTCPVPMDLDPDVQAFCAFDTDADMVADICALLCIVVNDDCPMGTVCEDIGIPPMMMMQFGICTTPA